MSCNKKTSVIILGKDYRQQKLMAFIIGTDCSALSKKDHPKKFKIFENDMYEFTCAPDLDTRGEDIREIFCENRHPDMCLMVVEKGFSPEIVWRQIESLQETTGRGTEEFIVVLPQGHSSTSYPFKAWTPEDLLRKLAEHRHQTNSKSSDDLSEEPNPSQTEEEAGCRYRKENFTDPKKRQKRKHASIKVNLVLLGMSGTGKSATGNVILGKKHFTSKVSSMAVTTECQMAETEINGTHVRVIDTPDIFDDDIEPSVRNKHVTTCRELCKSEPCVYLLVMHVSRFTDGERGILRKLEKAFGCQVKEHTVIVFTRGEDLHRAGMTFHEFLETCEDDLKKIVEKCDGRCVLFENGSTSSDQVNGSTSSDQVTKLMEKVDMLRPQI